MLLIYAMPHDEESERMRRALLREKIPCAITGPGKEFASCAGRVPLVMITESAAPYAESFRRSIPVRKLFQCAPDVSLVGAVREAYNYSTGLSFDTVRSPHVRIVEGRIYCRATRLYLTPNEERILTLLLLSQGNYFTADEVAAFCLLSGSSNAAAVHVCHINEKTYEACRHRGIECKRYRGYRIPATVAVRV